MTVDLISTVGFPIAAFVLMFWHNETTIRKLTTAINRNSKIIQKCKKK